MIEIYSTIFFFLIVKRQGLDERIFLENLPENAEIGYNFIT